MKQIIKKGSTSKRMAIFIADSSSTTGAGLAALAYNTSGLVWYYWREDAGNAGGTAVTLATATRGTWTSGGFKEIDATNLPGWYEIGIPDAVLASGAYWAVMMLKGAANMAPVVIEIQLVTYDPTDGNLGLTGLGGLTAPTAGALPTVGTGTNQISLSSGVALANLKQILGTALTETSAGQLEAAFKKFFDVSSPTGTVNDFPGVVPGSTGGFPVIGTGTRDINPNAGGVPISFTGRQQVWDFLFSDMTLTSGSIGKLIHDLLDAAISTRAAPGDAMNASQIAGSSSAATKLKDMMSTVLAGTVDDATFSPTTTAFETSFTTNRDLFTKQAIRFTSGNLSGLTADITTYTYTGNNKVKFTLSSALPVAPANGDSFHVFGRIE